MHDLYYNFETLLSLVCRLRPWTTSSRSTDQIGRSSDYLMLLSRLARDMGWAQTLIRHRVVTLSSPCMLLWMPLCLGDSQSRRELVDRPGGSSEAQECCTPESHMV